MTLKAVAEAAPAAVAVAAAYCLFLGVIYYAGEIYPLDPRALDFVGIDDYAQTAAVFLPIVVLTYGLILLVQGSAAMSASAAARLLRTLGSIGPGRTEFVRFVGLQVWGLVLFIGGLWITVWYMRANLTGMREAPYLGLTGFLLVCGSVLMLNAWARMAALGIPRHAVELLISAAGICAMTAMYGFEQGQFALLRSTDGIADVQLVAADDARRSFVLVARVSDGLIVMDSVNPHLSSFHETALGSGLRFIRSEDYRQLRMLTGLRARHD